MPPPTKRRRTNNKVEEITFNPEARHEYLTGFHKRKLQRKENAKEQAVKREKEERVRERRQLREQRKEDLENHVAQVNAELRKQNPDIASEVDSDDGHGDVNGWTGVKDDVPEVPDDEEEFVDEEKYTTVTVEPMADPGAELDEEDEVKATLAKKQAEAEAAKPKKRPWSKDGKAVVKKPKFRYESKAERSITRHKQKSKNSAAKARRTGN